MMIEINTMSIIELCIPINMFSKKALLYSPQCVFGKTWELTNSHCPVIDIVASAKMSKTVIVYFIKIKSHLWFKRCFNLLC